MTGGANGIGRAIGLRLAKEGVSIVIGDVDEANSTRSAAELRVLGAECLVIKSATSSGSLIGSYQDLWFQRIPHEKVRSRSSRKGGRDAWLRIIEMTHNSKISREE